MKEIRYGIHFAALAVAAVIFWMLRDVHYWISDFNLHYALMGALHATSIVVSLRGRKTVLRALGFITVAAALSTFTPFLSIFGSVVWFPFADILREMDLGADAILVTGSVIGASGYWLYVRRFWLGARRRASWIWPVALCAASTLLVGLIVRMFDGYDRGVAKIDTETISPMLTVAWWLAFSTGLYLSESTEEPSLVVDKALVD